ncbi:MAG: hypothetical protein ABSB67_19690 [Bryobacteraceae bacterium]
MDPARPLGQCPYRLEKTTIEVADKHDVGQGSFTREEIRVFADSKIGGLWQFVQEPEMGGVRIADHKNTWDGHQNSGYRTALCGLCFRKNAQTKNGGRSD